MSEIARVSPSPERTAMKTMTIARGDQPLTNGLITKGRQSRHPNQNTQAFGSRRPEQHRPQEETEGISWSRNSWKLDVLGIQCLPAALKYTKKTMQNAATGLKRQGQLPWALRPAPPLSSLQVRVHLAACTEQRQLYKCALTYPTATIQMRSY